MFKFSKFQIQHQSARQIVKHEDYSFETVVVLPSDRIPKLDKIVSMFVQGRPIDANLQRHLEFNDFENNPVLQKGFDLADFSKVAKANQVALEELNNEIEQARLRSMTKQEQLQDPSVQEPEPVKTD